MIFYYESPRAGWRSWNQFSTQINQTLIEATYDAMVKLRPRANGTGTTSLLHLGYRHAGIDDGWQKCDAGAGKGKEAGFHNASGYPLVDLSIFPDLRGMTGAHII
jgi:hypothetical protein